ncbi:NUDIX domain-containing protein [Arenibaculum sp.]|jgi:ADP-ribose pyrophosphatase YjhB (NUDIX family)|uniref:NUDIX domain-containing protein n=1 Tax=Arenibaculum sp. TaxID=2865862 RepID=UPI002E0E7E4D|nr:NUDIX domain-containing protein [Arenibaculum sp.]
MEMVELREARVGVGAFVLDGEKRLLLVKRRRDPEAGHWGLPGGKVEFLETVEAAAIREIKEELGLDIHLDRLLCVVNQISATEGVHWVAPVFLSTLAHGCAANRDPAAIEAVGWFDLTRLPTPLTVATVMALEAHGPAGIPPAPSEGTCGWRAG